MGKLKKLQIVEIISSLKNGSITILDSEDELYSRAISKS